MNLFRKILKDFPGRLRNVPCKARGFMRDYRSQFSRGDSSEYPVSPQTQNREQGLLSLSLELQKKFNICFTLVEVFVLVEHSLELNHSLN